MGVKGQAEFTRLNNAIEVILDIMRNGKYHSGNFSEKRADGWVIEFRKEDPL